MNPMTERRLRRSWGKVPYQRVLTHNWHSPEGQQFLDDVAAALQDGEDINEIGTLTGLRNFSQRWRILRGRKH